MANVETSGFELLHTALARFDSKRLRLVSKLKEYLGCEVSADVICTADLWLEEQENFMH